MPRSLVRPLLAVGLGGLLGALLAGAPAVTVTGWQAAFIAVAITLPITGGCSAGVLGLLAASWAGESWWIPAALLTALSIVALRHRLRWWWLAVGCAGAAGVLNTPLGAAVGLLGVGAARLLVPPTGRPRGLLTLINTVIGQGTFALACLTLPLALPVAWLFGRERVIAPLLCLGARLILSSAPFTVWRWQRESGLPLGPWVVASNHESVLDILTCLAVPGRARQLLAKPWVFRTPLLGWAAHLGGMLRVDRLAAGRISRALGCSDVVIFPEGSRRRLLGRFYSGAVQAAHDTGRPLVAMIQIGTARILAPRSLWIRPGIFTTYAASIPALTGNRIQRSSSLRAWFAQRLASFPKTAYGPRDWDATAQYPAARLRLLRTWLGLWSRR